MSPIRLALVALLLTRPAAAQYLFDINNADEQGPGVKYFGSAKDDNGALIPDVAVLIAKSFVLVTDKQGRYRGNVDTSTPFSENTVVCSKAGYEFVSVVKRPGPKTAAKQTVEANCVLRKK